MSFWSLRLVPGKVIPYVPTLEDEPRLHISQACLTPAYKGGGGNIYLMMKSEDSSETAVDGPKRSSSDEDFVVFSVLSETRQMSGLDIVVAGYTEFKVIGNAEVHLTGYHMPDVVDVEDEDYEEDAELEQNMPEIQFGQEEDDEEEEELDDDEHLENAPVKKLSCIIEEVDDEEEHAPQNKLQNKKQESRKRKKKHNKNEQFEQKEQLGGDDAGPSTKKIKSDDSKSTNLKKGQSKTFSSGLKITQKQVGFDDAKEARKGSSVRVSYVAKLHSNQKIIDQSQSFKFKLGQGKVVAGMEEGCVGMRVGDQRVIVCPPEMGYGSEGVKGSVPPNATLEFHVTLIHVK
eukprot:TRINITY_DN15799_c0_g1_i1.p1 TRINITY_DN15799_c0_g1~~TRINITY_DN15799_c0_g1_i1.p1  ORF type:complete len:376 (-),score=84.30 TRINITY_DN15799_c0_g1_i1:137-1171(-)